MVSLSPARSSSSAAAPCPTWPGAGGAPASPPEQLGTGDEPGPAHPSPPSQGLQLEQGWGCLCTPTATPVCSSHRPLKQCPSGDLLCTHSALLMARGQGTKGDPPILPHAGMGLTTSSSQQLPDVPRSPPTRGRDHLHPEPHAQPCLPHKADGGGKSARHTAAPRPLCDALLTPCSLAALRRWPCAGTPSSAAGCPPAATLYLAFSKREDSFPLSSSLFTRDKR